MNNLYDEFQIKLIPVSNLRNINNIIDNILSFYGNIINLFIQKKDNAYNIEVIFKSFLQINNFKNVYGDWIILNRKKSKNYYIKVENLKEIDFYKIFNLFNCYGNIKEIIKLINSDWIINYINYRGVKLAFEYLNNLIYMNKKIKLSWYKNFISNLNEKIYFNYKLNRFKKKNNYKVNTPINFIYFYNIDRRINTLNFYNIINKNHEFDIKIKRINNFKSSFLVKYPKEQKDLAIKALMELNNKLIKEPNYYFILKASFTHKKFN